MTPPRPTARASSSGNDPANVTAALSKVRPADRVIPRKEIQSAVRTVRRRRQPVSPCWSHRGERSGTPRRLEGANPVSEVGFVPSDKQAIHLPHHARTDDAQYQPANRSRRSDTTLS